MNLMLLIQYTFFMLIQFVFRFPLQQENGQTIECTVAQYFKDKYKLVLRYPHLPCLQVGQEQKHTYLPLEVSQDLYFFVPGCVSGFFFWTVLSFSLQVCNIVAGQRCIKKLTDNQTSTMIRATARSAPDRQDEISKLVGKFIPLVFAFREYWQNPTWQFFMRFGCFVTDEKCQLQHRSLRAWVWRNGQRRDDWGQWTGSSGTFNSLWRTGRNLS